MAENIVFIFEVMKMKSGNLNKHMDALDQKLSILFGFSAVVLSATFGFSKGRSVVICNPSFYLFCLGLFSILLAIFLCALALTSRFIYDAPHEDKLYSEESLGMEYNALVNQTVADMKAAYKGNLEVHERKTKLFNYSLAFLIVGLLSITVVFLFSLSV